jgi:hypothetical protein
VAASSARAEVFAPPSQKIPAARKLQTEAAQGLLRV